MLGANPLGLSLGFIEGTAIVSLRDHALVDGLTVRALELELHDVDFPLDLEGGAEEFQRRSTKLRSLVIDIELQFLSAQLEAVLDSISSPLRSPVLKSDRGQVTMEATLSDRVSDGERSAPVGARLLFAPAEDPRELRLYVLDNLVFGWVPVSAVGLPHLVEEICKHRLEQLEGAPVHLRRVASTSIGLDPVGPILWALLPRHGWKLPQHQDALIKGVEVNDGALRISIGQPPVSGGASLFVAGEDQTLERALLAALGREEALKAAEAADPHLASGELDQAFEEMRLVLDASGGPEVITERMFSIGMSLPDLHLQTRDLADDELARDEGAVHALLAKGAIASHDGLGEQAALFYEQAGRALKAQSQRRLAGLAYRTASDFRKDIRSERVRLLEETIALRPDDAIALEGLIEVLPGLGRASAAVRAARRLANLQRKPEKRAQAYVVAGRLLLDYAKDPVSAKREFDRALRLQPEERGALEGLARAMMAQGESRRAAELFERLIQKAEEEQALDRAMQLSMTLGDLWRPIDPEAALVRYRRAQALMPSNLEVQGRLARAAAEAGRREVAIEALELLLPELDQDIEQGAEAIELRMLAAKLYSEEADGSEDAKREYEAMLTASPEHSEALSALAKIYAQTGDNDKHAQVLRRRAEVLLRAEQYDEAAALFRAQAELAKSSVEAEALRGRLLTGLEHASGHRGLLDTYVELCQSIHEEHDGKIELVIDALDRRLLLEDPPEVRAQLLVRLGSGLEKVNRTADAVLAYESAYQEDPKNREAGFALLRLYRIREDRAKLSEVLAQVADQAESAEERAQLLTERARILTRGGYHSEGFDAVSTALSADPDNSEALGLAIDLALQLGALEQARTLSKDRLNRLGESDLEGQLNGYLSLAQVAEALGDQDELLDALKYAYELADSDGEQGQQIAARLARVLHEKERFDELAELERKRGRVATAKAPERAERFIHAARLSVQIDAQEQAERDVREALALLDAAGHTQLRLGALSVLEALARKREDPKALAEVINRRASVVSNNEEKAHLLLEEARVLEEGGLLEEAAASLEAARDRFPESAKIVTRLGEVFELLGWAGRAGDAFGQAANRLESRGELSGAVLSHSQAAEAFSNAQASEQAIIHDRAVLELSGRSGVAGIDDAVLERSLGRLERYARAGDDRSLLVEVLGRRARLCTPEQAAALLFEKADMETELKQDKAALESLKRARTLCPPKSVLAGRIAESLCENLERLGQYADQAAILVESAERAEDNTEKSALYLRSAKVYFEHLNERKMALSRVQASVRADAHNEEARAMRLQLLREGGRPQALIEALSEEAENTGRADRAAELWLEAAELLAPLQSVRLQDESIAPEAISRALALSRRAATAAPKSPTPLRQAAIYTGALSLWDEEFVALGQLVEREVEDPERAGAYLRRMELLAGPLDDTMGAQAELNTALAMMDSLGESSNQIAQFLPVSMRKELEGAERIIIGALRQGLRLTEVNEDWETHVRLLLRLVELSEDVEERAELRTRAGEVLEWKLGDGEGAEREYRTALALSPKRAHAALKSFYTAMDRFGDLAEHLGVDVLREVWDELRTASTQSSRLVAAAEALWPALPDGSAERAQVQLELADLYSVTEHEAADTVHVLEDVVQNAPLEHQDAALERLRVLFLENERFDLYCDVLRRQAERVEDDSARALALTDLGEALEWKLGDGQAAEREYQAALATDPGCDIARQKLMELLSSQDRFEEIGDTLGHDALEYVVFSLIDQGPRDHARAVQAAGALTQGRDAPETIWLSVADKLTASAGESWASDEFVETALLRAATKGTQAEALARLSALYEKTGDHAHLAQTLRDRLKICEAAEAPTLHLSLARVLSQSALSEEHEELEASLVAVRNAEPEGAQNEEATAMLLELYEAQRRFLLLGQTLGREALKKVKTRAEKEGDAETLKESLDALAKMSEGPERAAFLIDYAALLKAEGAQAEEAYRGALEAEPENERARAGLLSALQEAGRFREIAQTLGVQTLRETVAQVRAEEDQELVLPAMLALATVDDQATPDERADRLVQIARLHQLEEDGESQEHALKEALSIVPDHAGAKEELRAMFVAAGRLAELAQIDEALIEKTVRIASDAQNVQLERAARVALAERASGTMRADRLMALYELSLRQADEVTAEHHLRDALAADLAHASARATLTQLLWSKSRYSDLIESLSVEDFLMCATKAAEQAPTKVLESLESVRQMLPPQSRARSFELSAEVHQEPSHKLKHLEEARALWDAEGDAKARASVRLKIVELLSEDADAETLSEALQDTLAHVSDPKERGRLSVARARLLHAQEGHDPAEVCALLEPLVANPAVLSMHRIEAAKILVEQIKEAPEALELPELKRLELALSLLTKEEHTDPELEAWLLSLSTARELLGADMEEVARPLEAALRLAADRETVLEIRRRLRDIYEQLGDWKRAEAHASIIAEADDRPELWVGLSELRVWLDDRQGAEAALESALKKAPASKAAHEGLLRLAEQSGNTESVIKCLQRWATADEEGDRGERAQKLIKAAWFAVGRMDDERAGELAESAVAMLPRGDPHLVKVAGESCLVLEQVDKKEAMVTVLTRLVGEVQPGSVPRERLKLADLLIELKREDQARTLIEQGVHKNTPLEDPLLQRLINDALAGPAEEAARRLLSTAERIGAGPAAHKLRLVAAEKAEEAGDAEAAKVAWSTVVSQVGGGGEKRRARQALLRLTRTLDDPPALIEALLDAVDDASTSDARRELLVEASQVASDRVGDQARAELLLRRALDEVPEHADTLDRLADQLETNERWLELDELLEKRAGRLKGRERAQLLLRQANTAKARLHDETRSAALLKASYESAPSLESGREAVSALLRAHRFKDTAQLAQQILAELRPSDRDALSLELSRVVALERDGQVDAAIEAIGRIAEQSDQLPLLRSKRLELLYRHRRWRKLAEALLASADGVDPALGLRYRLAATRILLEREEDHVAAKASLHSAIKMIEGWLSEPEAEVSERLFLWALDDSPSGRRAINSSPLFDLAHLAEALGSHGDRLDVLRLYAQSLPVGPEQWRALLLLARAEQEAGEVDAAEFTLRGVVEAVRNAQDVPPDDRAEAERALGALLLERGNISEAAEALQQASNLLEMSQSTQPAQPAQPAQPVELRAQVLVQLAQAKRDRPEEALAALSRARVLVPDVVSDQDFEKAVEAAGPSEALARLFERRAEQGQRAENLREAARIWIAIGKRGRAFKPQRLAYEADPSDTKEAEKLQEALYQTERWDELESLLERRLELEELTESERVALMSARAAVLAERLFRPQEALELLQNARALAPSRVELLRSIIDYAERLGQIELAQDGLARMATMVTSNKAKRAALLRRGRLLLQGGHRVGAVQCIEEAFEATVNGTSPRGLAECLVELYRDDPKSEAMVWGRLAVRASGPKAAANFARVADIRAERLADRRGALAALEAGVRASPGDMGLRRALMEQAAQLGDFKRAQKHAHAAVAVARRESEIEAYLSFLMEEARFAGSADDVEGELACFKAALEERPGSAFLLGELVARTRTSLPGEEVLRMLVARTASLEPGRVRGHHRLAQARILEEPLGRHWEAEGVREDAEVEDFDGVQQPAAPVDALEGRVSFEESYRSTRAMLDRSGRWSELVELEERHAHHQDSPSSRAEAMVAVARLHLEQLPKDWPKHLEDETYDPEVRDKVEQAKGALERALTIHPSNAFALTALMELEVSCGAWEHAARVVDRLELVGGPGWPAPRFELLAAEVAEATSDQELAIARLLRGRARDPGSSTVLWRLSRLCRETDRKAEAIRWLKTLEQVLDPLLERAQLADCLVEQAELLFEMDAETSGAFELVSAALEYVPDHSGAQALRRRALERSGKQGLLLEILEDDARRQRQSAETSMGLWLQAFSLASTDSRKARIAKKLEAHVKEAKVRELLLDFYVARREGAGLMRMADGGALDIASLSWEVAASLAAAYLSQDRRTEAFEVLVAHPEDFERSAYFIDRALGGEASLLAVIHRFQELLHASPAPLSQLEGAVLELLRGMCMSGGRPAELLCEIYLSKGVQGEGAIMLYRRLLQDDPVDAVVSEQLARALESGGAQQDAEPVRSVLRFLNGESARLRPLERRPQGRFMEHLAHEAVRSPLGELLRLTARATAAILPPSEAIFSERRPAKDDVRLANVIEQLIKVSQEPFEVLIDPDGGDLVTIEPGDPAVVVVGEALCDDATPTELRFHLAKAVMLIELGFLLPLTTGGATRRTFLELLLAAADLETTKGAPPGLEEALSGIRSRLGPMGLARLAPIAEELTGAVQSERAFERWVRGAQATADRFGILVSGSLPASVRALRRGEPRSLTEDFEDPETRRASVRRWAALSALVAFVLSQEYIELLRMFPKGEQARF